jgi:chloramphenicol 3-O phosphotransferase
MASGRIIFLNGSSSAGKTTLASTLQQLLDEPYQHIALDQFRDGLPGRYRGLNSPPGTPGALGLNIVPRELDGERVSHIEMGAHAEQVLRGMRRAIAAFAAQGNHVIIDDLLFRREYLDDYPEALAQFEVWFVGVRCRLEVVNAREEKRIGRFPGTATSHFATVHAHGCPYDIEVETSQRTPRACAEDIVAAMRSGRPPCAFDRWRSILSGDRR